MVRKQEYEVWGEPEVSSWFPVHRNRWLKAISPGTVPLVCVLLSTTNNILSKFRRVQLNKKKQVLQTKGNFLPLDLNLTHSPPKIFVI